MIVADRADRFRAGKFPALMRRRKQPETRAREYEAYLDSLQQNARQPAPQAPAASGPDPELGLGLAETLGLYGAKGQPDVGRSGVAAASTMRE